jgi:hypothetical protein
MKIVKFMQIKLIILDQWRQTISHEKFSAFWLLATWTAAKQHVVFSWHLHRIDNIAALIEVKDLAVLGHY